MGLGERVPGVTIIIPFHRNVHQLQASLTAARSSMPDAEIILAADGATEDYRPLAVAANARIVEVPGPSGPAVARNRAAAVAGGDILVFVDTDVVVHERTIPGMCATLRDEPNLGAVFGAYDLSPAEPDFMSQYKNLSHAYVHERGNREAKTFWAGLGAIRSRVFHSVGGFDERFTRPSVEDIELGYRIVARGHAIRLDPQFRACHLKRWTIWNTVVTDIFARGVPWTQLIHRAGGLANDLNTGIAQRLSVVLAYVIVLSILGWWLSPWAIAGTAVLLSIFVFLNLDYYRWFRRQRGLWFACRVVGAHLLYHLCNGVSFTVGSILHVAARNGWTMPGSVPEGIWGGGSPSSTKSPRREISS